MFAWEWWTTWGKEEPRVKEKDRVDEARGETTQELWKSISRYIGGNLLDYSHSLCFLSILHFLLLSLFSFLILGWLFGYKCDAVLLSSVFLLIWIWLIPILVFILNSPDAPLARTPGSEYERGSHLMLCSLCFALFWARYIPFFSFFILLYF